MSKLEIPHPFDFHQQLSEVVLVGTGGTGSQVARTLCRIVYDLRRRGHHTPSLKFVDPDIVEPKNVGRQMFTESQIGKPKATTLAAQFNLAMGLGIVAYAEPFDADKHARRYGSLVIGCVDNHLARRELSKTSGLWLDCGNDKTNGQVCLGNTSKPDEVKRAIKAKQFSYLPNAALIFPQLLEPEPAPEPMPTPATSCADMLEAGDQALLVNDMVGIVAGEYLYKLLNQLPILSFLTYIDAEALSMHSIPITPDNLNQFILPR